MTPRLAAPPCLCDVRLTFRRRESTTAPSAVDFRTRSVHSDIKWADDCIEGILWNREEIEVMAAKLGKQISADYKGKDLIVVGLLDGVFMFFADLTRHVCPLPNTRTCAHQPPPAHQWPKLSPEISACSPL